MKGWKPLPTSLKVLFVVLLLWVMMTIAVSVSMPDRQIAFLGMLVEGISATIVVLVLDIISPLVFLYATWNKIKWGAAFGMVYNGVFILNCIIALVLFKDVFGDGIYFPLIAGIIFFSIIFKERRYFS